MIVLKIWQLKTPPRKTIFKADDPSIFSGMRVDIHLIISEWQQEITCMVDMAFCLVDCQIAMAECCLKKGQEWPVRQPIHRDFENLEF